MVNNNVINPNKSSNTNEASNQNSPSSQSVLSNGSVGNVPDNETNDKPVLSVQSSVASVQHSPSVVLSSTAIPTATVQLSGGGKRLQTRFLFDTGSQRTFICPALVQELNIKPSELKEHICRVILNCLCHSLSYGQSKIS